MQIEQDLLSGVEQALLAIMILVIMFGMGASLSPGDFKEALKRPRAILIGFISQFGLMPLLAFSLAKLLGLPPALAIALILIGCLPGGTTSNMFAYFARGSVALSISMTAASTVLAIVTLPLLLEVYAAGFAREMTAAMAAEGFEGEFVIPHVNIVVSLLLVIFPVALGMVLKKRSPGWAKTAEDTASFTGLVVILFLLCSVSIRSGNLFFQTPWQIYVASISIGLSGFLFGWLMAFVTRLAPRYRRAISLETGIQNGPIAFAIIMLSFTGSVADEMLWLGILYSTFIVITASLITLVYRKYGLFDWELHRNRTIHRRLFGAQYWAPYPTERLERSEPIQRGQLRTD